MPAPTASAKLLDPVLQIAQHSRQDLQGLLSAVQLDDIEKDKPGARIPAAAFCRLLEELSQRSGNERIALRVGEATQPRMLGSIGFLMATAEDLQSSFQVLIDYLPLLCEGIHLQMDQLAEGTQLLVELENSKERKTAEWFLACLLNWPRWLSGKQVPALSVQLIYPPPHDPGNYERFFASEIEYNADHNRLLIPNSYLKLPCLDANEEMHRLHLEFADNLLSASGREGALIAQVKSQIRHGLTDAQGGVRREKIAANLNLSLRTLQRKLGSLNTNFQDLYDQTRKELALQQIQKGGISFGELSFMLGFSNQSAFQKAFKRWLGVPPSQYREKIKPKAAIATEDSRAKTLADLIKTASINADNFYSLAQQLTAAIDQLHKQGDRAHDLYPNHIAVETTVNDTRLSLIDPNPLLPVKALERLHYLAPEQSGLIATETDYRADLYTLGCIFYEMLNGLPPYASEDAGELLRAHLSAPIPAMEQLTPALGIIIRRLLSKEPDDRYQSCHGIIADLLHCQQAQQNALTDSAGSQDPDFESGRHDSSEQLIFPQRLYGRGRLLEILHAEWNQTTSGGGRQLLISGPAGVGKSTIINRLRPLVLQHQGLFISGNFDSLQRQHPYSGFIQALQQLIRQKLATPRKEFQRWKRQLLQRGGYNMRLLAGMIPELQFIDDAAPLRDQPGPVELEQRICAAFVSFFCGANKQPLLIFLDNVQWMDSASLALFKVLCQRSEKTPLLIVGAYRNEELELSSPLSSFLPELKRSPSCRLLPIPPLQSEHTRQLIADIFHQQGSEPVSLAGWLHRKTQGNPFFIRRYIQQLHQKRWIFFDQEKQCWGWKQQVFEEADLPTDIRELIEFQITKLPELTQKFISWGAAIGSSFDLSTLSKACGEPLARVAIHLWPAVQEGLVVSQGGETQASSYRFLHDNIRHNAYHRINKDQRQQMHLSIGTILLREYSRNERGGKIYDLVNHLNLAGPSQQSHESRLELIQLNLRAAEKATLASAFKPASGFLRHGLTLLQPEDWQQHYDLCVRLYLKLAQTAYLCGDFDQADTLYIDMQQHFVNAADLAQVSLLQARQHLLQDKNSDALNAIESGLKLLQQTLPNTQTELRQLIQQLALHFDHQPIVDPSLMPDMKGSSPIAMELLQLLSQTAERCDNPLLTAGALARMTQLSIEEGRSPQLPIALAGYGHLCSWIYGDSQQGQAFSRQSLVIAEHSDRRSVRAKTCFINGAKNIHWNAHLKESLPLLNNAQELALESGDWYSAGQSVLLGALNRCFLGQPLTSLEQPFEDARQLLTRIDNSHLINAFEHSAWSFRQRLLAGKDDADANSSCDQDNQTTYPLSCWQGMTDICTSYLLEQQHLWPRLLSLEPQLELQLGGQYATTEMLFFTALMRLKLCQNSNQQQQNALLKEITFIETRMELWARDCPQNFAHRRALIGANRAMLQQLPDHAMELFEKAIDGAESQGYLHHQALANEHYGRFWLARGSRKVAQYFIAEAQQLYQRWGANEKAKTLDPLT
ncbi:MAG: AraC family transcriptional regulator ligand-binding domain-containing protein [Motiliproteus sp.]